MKSVLHAKRDGESEPLAKDTARHTDVYFLEMQCILDQNFQPSPVPAAPSFLEQLDMLSKGSGLVRVDSASRSASENELLESHPWRARLLSCLHRAGEFGADRVYFRLHPGAGAPRPELFIYDWQDSLKLEAKRATLPDLYRHLWNYGQVPLLLALTPTTADLFNLLPQPHPDKKGTFPFPPLIEAIPLSPADSLALAGAATKGLVKLQPPAWQRFSAFRFDNGAFWEAEENRDLGSNATSALDALVSEMRDARIRIEKTTVLPDVSEAEKEAFVRRLLIITLMVRFLEDRGILPTGYFKDADYLGAENFSQLLRHPRAVLRAIKRLNDDFNGDVFHIDDRLLEILRDAPESSLTPLANFAAGNMQGQQAFFWQRYSFRHLPVEVISYVYEDFLGGRSQSFFTPHHLVDLLLDEAMPEKEVVAALEKNDPRRADASAAFPVLDPAAGSGVFLVGAWRRLVEAFLVIEPSPPPAILKRLMTDNVFGVDIEKDSVELTIFSLCVALCSRFPQRPDDPSYVLNQLRELKFPSLKNSNVFERDFFVERSSLLNDSRRFRLIAGNPPFESDLKGEAQLTLDGTPEDEDGKKWPRVPDHQISYLFLRGVMPLLAEGGTACLVQPASLIYNEKPAAFRRSLIENWHVSQVLDFASINGLFETRKKSKPGSASAKVGVKTVAVFMHRMEPISDKPLLHATFRRTTLLNQRQVFEMDPQDLHWISRELTASEPRVWKSNLLGGGRLLETYQNLTANGTLGDHINRMKKERGWVSSEGFIEADVESYTSEKASDKKKRYKPEHRPERAEWDLLETEALSEVGIDPSGIERCGVEWYLWPRDDRLFSPPHLLIKEHESLPLALRESGSTLLFRHEIVGIAAPESDRSQLRAMYDALLSLRASMPFFAAFGPRYLTGRQTAMLKKDILDLPYSGDGELIFRGVQKHLRDDVIEFMIPLIKDNDATHRGLAAAASEAQVKAYGKVFAKLMHSAYPSFHSVAVHDLDTAWCAAFHGGDGTPAAFGDGEALRQHVDGLLSRETGRALRTHRVVRFFAGEDLFIIKPKPRRYWLKSAGVRDADATFGWLMKKAVHKVKRRAPAAGII